MKIYISIPISGHSISVQQKKIDEIVEKLRELGHEPINPFDTPPPSEELDEKSKYAYYMGENLKRLLMCDAIFMCPHWATNKGCKIEAITANIMGLEIFCGYGLIPNNK